MSRTRNSARNAAAALTTQFVTILLSFVTRTAFINYLGIEYLGLNSVLTNLATILALAEAGLGSAHAFSLYAPLSAGDTSRVASLTRFFGRAYRGIALLVAIIGAGIYPLLPATVPEHNEFEFFPVIYALFVLNTALTYLALHYSVLIISDQQGHLVSYIQVVASILRAALQIGVLIVSQSFLLFLLAQITTTLLENLAVRRKARLLFPATTKLQHRRLSASDRKDVLRDLRSLALYRAGNTALNGTDAILVSSFLGLALAGRLANYTLILGAASTVLYKATSAITASVGNFAANESPRRQHELLLVLTFGHALVYGIAAAALNASLNTFIGLWLGSEFLLSPIALTIICANWFLLGLLQPLWTFRTALGIFKPGRYRPLVSAVVNLAVSIALVNVMGIYGILVGTTAALLLVSFTVEPRVIHRVGLSAPTGRYYARTLGYTGIVVLGLLAGHAAQWMSVSSPVLECFLQAVAFGALTSLLFVAVYGRSAEGRYVRGLVRGLGTSRGN